jgi:hypothetical protein
MAKSVMSGKIKFNMNFIKQQNSSVDIGISIIVVLIFALPTGFN